MKQNDVYTEMLDKEIGARMRNALRVYENLDQNVIIVNEDKLWRCLTPVIERAGRQYGWVAPLSLIVACLATLVTADFRATSGIPKDIWQRIFEMGFVASLIWLVCAVWRAVIAWRSKDIESVFRELKAATGVSKDYPSLAPQAHDATTEDRHDSLLQLLTTHCFELYYGSQEFAHKTIMFSPNGRVINGNHNEFTWAIDKGKLVFFDDKEKLFSRFVYDSMDQGFVNTKDPDTNPKAKKNQSLVVLGPRWQVVSAIYGTDSKHQFDVTNPIKSCIKLNTLNIVADNYIIDPNKCHDPHPDQEKKLTVVYKIRGEQKTKTVAEGETMVLPE